MNGDVQPNLLRPRWRKVFSDLWNDKSRTALVVASIAAGVFAVGMIITAYVVLGEDINRNYAAVNPPNIEVWTDPFDQDFVHAVEKVPGVAAAEGRRLVDVRARRANGGWQALTLVGVSAISGDIARLTTLEGTQQAGKGDVVVSQDPLHITGFHTGDSIEVVLPDGSSHTLRVAGLVSDQTTSKPDPTASNFGFVTLKTLDALGQPDTFNQLYVTVEGDGSQSAFIAAVAAQVRDQVKNSQRTAYRMEQYLSTRHPMASVSLAVLGLLGALGGLITLLSSSLIINTLNALLAQQLRQIGVMKLVGARSTQILGMYLILVAVYSLIALALAAPLGTLAGYGLAWLIALLLGAVLQGFRVVPIAIIVQTAIAFLVPLAAGFIPVNSGARTSVQQAISDYRPSGASAGGGFLARHARWFGWISRPILLSFRNTFRKQGRLLLTLFTLTVAGGVFIAVFNTRDSLNTMLGQLLLNFTSDVSVDLRNPYRVEEVQQALLQVPGIKGVEAWTAVSGEVRDQNEAVVTNLSIVAPPQNTQLLPLKLTAGRWLLPHETQAMVVSDSIYQKLPNLKLGDSLRVKLPGRPVESWTVVGIFPFLAMFGDPMAYANFDFIADRTFLPNQSSSYRIITNAHDGASQDALARRIDSYLTARDYAVQGIDTGADVRGKATFGLDTLIVFMLLMAVLTAFVGSIGLTGAMSINVLERTREIGVLRTIGAIDRVIMQSVMIEALVIGLITWVLAIGLSVPISYLLCQIIGNAMLGTALALRFTPLGILLWLAVVVILAVVASLMPARKAARLTINEVLAYE